MLFQIESKAWEEIGWELFFKQNVTVIYVVYWGSDLIDVTVETSDDLHPVV